MLNFSDFWQQYPKKVAKKDAEKAWNRLNDAQQQKAIESIPNHIKCWCAECRQAHYIPNAATWLNAERWDDEIQLPEPELKTTSNILAFAKQKGIEAKRGESMQEFTDRLRMMR